MLKTLACCTVILPILIVTTQADWTVPEQVNKTEYEYGLAACRDSDTPWGIAADDSGNVHFVIETEGESVPPNSDVLDIHYRVKFVSGVWSDEFPITTNEPTLSDPNYQNHVHGFGHPSIIFDNDGIGLIGYLMDEGTVPPLEMRAVDFDFTSYPDPLGDFYFMSEEGSPYIKSGLGGARKVPVMSMDNNGKIYCFWPYFIDLGGGSATFHIYFRTYENGTWSSEGELPPLSEEEYIVSAINTLADPNGDIHLAIDMQYDPENESREIYHCWYDVSADDWSDLEIVSEISEPDGNNSILPYLAFKYVASGYKMYVVWGDYVTEEADKRVILRIYDSASDSWNTEILIADDLAEKPCVAVQTNGDICVVWQDIINSEDWIYYKYYDFSSSSWSSVQQVADNEDLNWLRTPTIICDRWDNFHLAACGEVDSLDGDDEYEVFYSFFDAPPHIEDLEFLSGESDEDSVVISWTGWDEPDLDTYKVYRKYLGGRWEYVNSTTETRYSDTESSYSPSGFSQIDYYVVAEDDADQRTYSDTIIVMGTEQNKMVSDGYARACFELGGNYPNPFNAHTTISYNLPRRSDVILEVFDILGRRVETLVDEFQSPGPHSVTWDASRVASGMYFYKLASGEYSTTRRMTIIK